MQRTYTGFSSHSIIYFSITVHFGGSWQPSDSLILQLDDTYTQVFSLWPSVNGHTTDTCETLSLSSTKTQIVGKAFHSSDNLNLKLSWKTHGSATPVPFFAIRDVLMSFGMKKSSDVEEAYVNIGDTNVQKSTSCSGNLFYDLTTSSCRPCDAACSQCFGASNAQCYSFSWTHYYDGSQVTLCSPLCNGCYGPNANQCYSCTGSTPYLNKDNYCQGTCPPTDFIIDPLGVNQCISKCPTGQYLYWDFTCATSCDPPLISSIDSQSNALCKYPCAQSAHSFLYWNGSCLTTCPYFSRNENNYHFCDACQPGYYLYKYGTCLPTCHLGFASESIGDSLFCHSPCGADQYLYPDGSCQTTCPTSFIQNVEGHSYFCTFYLTSKEHSQAKNIAATQKVLGAALGSCAAILSAMNFANPTVMLINILSDMLQYLRYISISYPPKLQTVLDSADTFSINILPDIPSSLAAHFPNTTLPANFQKYDLPSSFFINFWSSGIDLLLMVIGFVAVLVVTKCSANGCCRRIQQYFVKMKQAMKWNFMLVMFLSYYGQIVFYTSFELRQKFFSAAGPIISLILCLAINIVSIFVFAIMLKVVTVAIRLAKNRIATVSPSAQHHQTTDLVKWIDFSMLFESFHDHSFLQQVYVPLFTIRMCLFYAFISYLYSYPLTTMTLITLMSIIAVVYLVFVQPQRSRIELYECIFPECVLLLINICVLVLAILDKKSADVQSAREITGDMVIWVNTVFRAISTAYFSIKMLVQITGKIRAACNKSARTNVLQTNAVINIAQEQTIVKNMTQSPKIGDLSHLRSGQIPRHHHPTILEQKCNTEMVNRDQGTLKAGRISPTSRDQSQDSSAYIFNNQLNGSSSYIFDQSAQMQRADVEDNSIKDQNMNESRNDYTPDSVKKGVDKCLESPPKRGAITNFSRDPNQKLVLDQIRKANGYFDVPADDSYNRGKRTNHRRKI